MRTSTLNPTTASVVQELRSLLRGRVITPDDPTYDEDRAVFFGNFDRRPAAIARPADEIDVSRVVKLVRAAGLELAVRSGGHSLTGHSTTEGGIVLDLRSMTALEIDTEGRAAWAQTGLTTGEYTSATAAFGLTTGFGDTGSVGIGGITLGGGVGFLVRKHGLTIDNVLAAEVVTADGEVRHVDSETHPDLYWAIRGGGGNFGVATRLRFRLHEVGTVVGGILVLPATSDVVASFVDAAEAAPDELSAIANVMTAPPMPFLPQEHHGKPVVLALLVYAGDIDAGQRVVAPFRALATPLADLMRPMPYPEVFMHAPGEGRPLVAAQTLFIDDLDRGTAETMLDHLGAGTAPLRAVQVRVLGGAAARVPDDATAYAHRGRRIMVNVSAMDGRPDRIAAHEAWAADAAAAIRRGEKGAYANFLGNNQRARLDEVYPGATLDRLIAVKRRYDPTNVFRLNLNIPPEAEQLTPAGAA